MNIEMDLNGIERQRYKKIKESGQYLEFLTLIGVDDMTGNKEGNMPIVQLMLHNCSGKEISMFYVSLKNIIKKLYEEHPMECALGDLGILDCEDLGVIKSKPDDEED